MSRHALGGDPPTHCDDLESVYYLLILIVASHTGLDTPQLPFSHLPEGLKLWMNTDPAVVSSSKNVHLEAEESKFPVQDVFLVLKPLTVQLHRFFRIRQDSTDMTDPQQDFHEILGYFDETLRSMPESLRKRTYDDSNNSDGGDRARISEGGVEKNPWPDNKVPEDLERDGKRVKT
jgi:hypothetical protein